MNEILIINDEATQGVQAAEYAFMLAKLLSKNLLVANISHFEKVGSRKKIQLVSGLNEFPVHDLGDEEPVTDLISRLNTLSASETAFKPEVNVVNMSGVSEMDLAVFINHSQISLMIYGIQTTTTVVNSSLDVQLILNRVACPLLLVPAAYNVRNLERIVYLTDLRFCLTSILGYLARLNRENKNILLAHLCAEGMVDLADGYASDLFNQQVRRNIPGTPLSFTHIKEKDVNRSVDVLINTMQADLLVCVNRQFHFKAILGERIASVLPEFISIPILIFPY